MSTGGFNKLDGVIVIPTTVGEIQLKRQVSNEVKAKFKDWLELSARRRIARIRKQLGEKAYAEDMVSVNAASASGKLAWGGEAFRMAVSDAAGIVQLIVLLAEAAGQAVEPEQIMVVMNNEADQTVLLAAFREVMDSNPNFLVPPPMGMTT